MGNKSRLNWNINFCMRACVNREEKTCKECIHFSKFIPEEEKAKE
jgi:hypothetical protein